MRSSFAVAVLLQGCLGLSLAAPPSSGGGKGTNAEDIEIIGGFVLFRRINSTTQYLLLEKAKEPGDWSPPKGHTEGDEHPIDAAFRETREETGLLPQHYELMVGYQHYFEYETKDGDKKHVSLWTAQLTALEQPIVLSSESRDYKWTDLEETIQIVKKQYKDAYVRLLALVQCHFDLVAC